MACHDLPPSSVQLWQPCVWWRIVSVALFVAATAEPATASATSMESASFMSGTPLVWKRSGPHSAARSELLALDRRDRLRGLRAALDGLRGLFATAERSADHEDAEPEPCEEKRDADDDAEERDVLCQEARVERRRQRGLRDPGGPDRVV